MTHSDFNHLLSSLEGLSAEQARQLRQQLDRQIAQPKAPAVRKPAKRARAATPKKKPLTRDEFNQHLLKIGLISSLPDPSLDIDDDDPDDQPVTIKGEPLSETIIRERR
jgi:UDP:flavonoid glycosyltransferase YjiC (YdhE family)